MNDIDPGSPKVSPACRLEKLDDFQSFFLVEAPSLWSEAEVASLPTHQGVGVSISS